VANDVDRHDQFIEQGSDDGDTSSIDSNTHGVQFRNHRNGLLQGTAQEQKFIS
jgi:hypothetical protein